MSKEGSDYYAESVVMANRITLSLEARAVVASNLAIVDQLRSDEAMNHERHLQLLDAIERSSS